MSVRAFIAVGSNLGDREGNARRAVETLRFSPGVTVVRESSLYESDPVGMAGNFVDQPPFINSACLVETTLTASGLLDLLKSVERAFGREEGGERWAPRVLDLDIIFYGNEVVDDKKDDGALIIPHPRAHERCFVIYPVAEIGGEFTHPLLAVTVGEIAERLEEAGGGRCRRIAGS